MAPGANINYMNGYALFEATHGTAPKHAGLDKVNPGSLLLSAAMMLRYSLGMEAEATAVETAVDVVLSKGHRTRDLAKPGEKTLDTAEMTEMIVEKLSE